MAAVLETVADNRRLLATAEAREARSTVREYAEIQRRLRRATQKVDYLVRSGRSTSVATLSRAAEFRRMTDEASELLLKAAGNTAVATDRVSRYALELARATANARFVNAAAPVTLLPEAALEQIVLGTRSGPVRAVLERRAGDAAEQVSRELIRGVAEGWDARVVTRRVVAISDMEQHQALTIVRTEMMRAHREGVRQDLLRSPDAAQGWTWVAQLDKTSCAVCWAFHGRTFTSSEPMPTHPRCRCHLVPTAGLPNGVATGAERFTTLSTRQQDWVLGPAAGRAYRDGRIALADVAGTADHPIWGPVAVRRSLRSVVGADDAAGYLRPA